MKIAVGEIRLSNRPLLYSNADSGHRFWARRHPSHAIAGGGTPGHCDGGADSVTSRSSGCATLVAMVQPADLWEGDNDAGRGRLSRPRLGAILG